MMATAVQAWSPAVPQSADGRDSGAYRVARELRLQTDGPRLSGYTLGFAPDWRVGVDVTTFFRDAEFMMPYTRGYTATGFFVAPYATRRVGERAQFTLGVRLAGVAGYPGLRRWWPLVRMEYAPHDNVRLVMGSLYGTLSHGLYEPMLDRERWVYDPYEEGVQILATLPLGSTRWHTDTWLYWEELLEPWQPRQERFTLGSTHEWQLTGADGQSPFVLSLPLSFLGSHRGGQFSALDTCIQSLFNESVALRASVSTGRRSALALDVPLFFYQDVSPKKCLAFADGWGFWPHLSFDGTWVPAGGGRDWRMLLQAGYWQGNRFIAPRGSYLFQSVSWHKAEFTAPDRRMLTAKAAVENRYGDTFALGLDAELYYDMELRGLDVAFGLYMRYRP